MDQTVNTIPTTETETCEVCIASAPTSETLVHHADGSSTLMCVKCPFCQEIVNAHMTKTTISCPACRITVSY